MEADEVNKFKAVCKGFLQERGLTVRFDTAVSEEVSWRPHIFATNNERLILDILTRETLPDFYIKKYAEIRNHLPSVGIYLGLVGDLNYFPEVILQCSKNGFGIYKIDGTLKLLIETRSPTIEELTDEGQMAIVSGRPYRNILALRKCLRRCRSHIFWFERNLPKKALETLFEAIEDGSIHDVETIKLLRGLDEQVEALRDEFLRFKAELNSLGIGSELRIICDSSLAQNIHGRYIYSEDDTHQLIKMQLPPLNSLRANQWDTILTDVSEIPPFQDFWESGLDIERAWNDIERIMRQYYRSRAGQLEEQARGLRSRAERP
jgi:hypothetical protein